MGSSPLMSWSLFVKFMVISSQDNRKVAAKSPFKINRELIRILGAEPHGVTKQRSNWKMFCRFWTSLWLLGPTRASTLPRVSSNIATFRIVRKTSLWTNFLTSFTPDASMCERETSGFQPTQSSWLSLASDKLESWLPYGTSETVCSFSDALLHTS